MLSIVPTYIPMANSLKLTKETNTLPIDPMRYQKADWRIKLPDQDTLGHSVRGFFPESFYAPSTRTALSRYSCCVTVPATLSFLWPMVPAGGANQTTKILRRRLWRRHRRTQVYRSVHLYYGENSNFLVLKKTERHTTVWLRLVTELGFHDQEPTTIWCDNQSSIKIATK